ncbi:unnamed protein product (macronuclear) [Paramecium tetraurelia]|uniref:Uncharacterized protein n=1 Tax=Paramecium tetraurelia TaxID=5888 RepID=A0CQN8_PARTE|nr:uncharacterized protein GSPATT00009453001 [Paramecium tetraurelia]CAK73105.1 unnamed protein product [Paramecium tetraurelia]|eukprot:XP_001440502.1 hypothetical protein (macronuclear) [Paramecium tetraurelia strain d4-2]
MQYIQYHPQIIEEFKMIDTKSLFQTMESSIIQKFEDKESFKEVYYYYTIIKKKDQSNSKFNLDQILFQMIINIFYCASAFMKCDILS